MHDNKKIIKEEKASKDHLHLFFWRIPAELFKVLKMFSWD